MRNITLNNQAPEDLHFWSKNDLKLLKKVFELLVSITKTPTKGIGKPEGLKADLKGYWSLRISDEHRIVYSITEESIIVISCSIHYNF